MSRKKQLSPWDSCENERHSTGPNPTERRVTKRHEKEQATHGKERKLGGSAMCEPSRRTVLQPVVLDDSKPCRTKRDQRTSGACVNVPLVSRKTAGSHGRSCLKVVTARDRTTRYETLPYGKVPHGTGKNGRIRKVRILPKHLTLLNNTGSNENRPKRKGRDVNMPCSEVPNRIGYVSACTGRALFVGCPSPSVVSSPPSPPASSDSACSSLYGMSSESSARATSP